MKWLILTAGFMLTAGTTFADTSANGAIFTIDEGVDFTLGNIGASDFLFSWSDPDGDAFANVVDPTLILTAGETYTFVRATSAHPFIIMDASAAAFISGTDGSYQRTTTNGALLDAATLQPIADFTADPFPSGDVITWTPEVGDYWYTCRVTGHLGMTGRIQVVPVQSAPCPADVDNSGAIDLDDLNIVLTNFGQNTSNGDTDGNGVVDLDDLNAVLTAFGQTCP